MTTGKRRVALLVGTVLLVGTAVTAFLLIRSLTPPIGAWFAGRVQPDQVIVVQATYPGANAQVLVDTIAAPTEHQVNGVERMLSLSSLSTQEGRYTLHIAFEQGMDLDQAQVLVQNRVSLAAPGFPQVMQQSGVTVRKQSRHPLLLVSLTSPDGRYDGLYLSNYAELQIRDELARLPGVADIGLLGQRLSSVRFWLDQNKLAERGLSAADFTQAIEQQHGPVIASPISEPPAAQGQELQYTLGPLGRLKDIEEFGSVILKTDNTGRLVRLRDVARIELGVRQNDPICDLDGMPAVVLSIHTLATPGPGAVSRTVLDKLATAGPCAGRRPHYGRVRFLGKPDRLAGRAETSGRRCRDAGQGLGGAHQGGSGKVPCDPAEEP